MTSNGRPSGSRPENPAATAEAAERTSHPVRAILVATDLSARSDRAIERALELTGRHGARLTILHIVDENLPIAARDRVVEAAKDEITDCVTKAGHPDSADISISVVPGMDHRDILEAADSGEVDLIMLGVHRNEAGDRPITGTTMERVIRKSTRPALVVASRVRGAYNKVMIAVDFSVYSRFAIRSAFALAPGAEFFFVHAFRVPFEGFQTGRETRRAVKEEEERELARMIEEEMVALISASPGASGGDGQMHRILRHGEVHSVLREEAERLQPDLLVLGTHGRAGVSHMVLGSIAEAYLNRPPCDVLAVKAW